MEDDDDSVFIVDPDFGGAVTECDPYVQDCPEGEKCNAWADDGGSSWNALGCFPIDDNPDQIGDPCTVEGSGVSGIDSCDIGLMCWDVDPETNMGTCISLCQGSPDDPTCPDPLTICIIANDGVLNLCLPMCDPLVQDCGLGEACYPISDGFVCAPDASGDDLGAYGDPCEYINACDPFNACVNPDTVPGCAGAAGCCSPFCDVTDPTSSMSCPGFAGGQECIAWFEEGLAPPGFEDVGVCAIPS
jgi:hypothetical protein